MKRTWLAAVLLLCGVAAARDTKIGVKVVQIAGGRVYLEPGADAGLRVGTTVELHGRRFKILSVTAGHAVIDPGDSRLAEGEKGSAAVSSRAVATERMPAPAPLTRWAGQ